MKALLIGVYHDLKTDSNCLTRFSKNVDKKIIDHFEATTNTLGPLKFNKTRLFYNLTDTFVIVSFVGLGDKDASFCKRDELHFDKENIKKAISTGIDSIKKASNKIKTIILDDCNGNFSLIGETVGLSQYSYKDYVDLEKDNIKDSISFDLNKLSIEDEELFKKGLMLANLQNLSRLLSETPSNLTTPTRIAEFAKEFATKNNIEVIVHEKEWLKEKGMNAFLAVAQGSCEPCKFVELHYKNGDCEQEKPFILVGKGITFDSGGLSLKKASGMDSQRADMTGAACVLSVLVGIAKLKLKGHFIGLMPLTENMPGSSAVKPGDVVFAMNGKSIQINNTDAEGRLVLADALCYADTFNPEVVIDIATLTGAAKTAIGTCATPVFSTSDELFDQLSKAGQLTGNRVWRFPLFSDYVKKTTNSILADTVNQCKDSGFGGNACIAAAFLTQFTNCKNYIHMDIASTKLISSDCGYMSGGRMSGGPCRTLLNFIEKLYS